MSRRTIAFWLLFAATLIDLLRHRRLVVADDRRRGGRHCAVRHAPARLHLRRGEGVPRGADAARRRHLPRAAASARHSPIRRSSAPRCSSPSTCWRRCAGAPGAGCWRRPPSLPRSSTIWRTTPSRSCSAPVPMASRRRTWRWPAAGPCSRARRATVAMVILMAFLIGWAVNRLTAGDPRAAASPGARVTTTPIRGPE